MSKPISEDGNVITADFGNKRTPELTLSIGVETQILFRDEYLIVARLTPIVNGHRGRPIHVMSEQPKQQ